MKVKFVRKSRWDHPGIFPDFAKGTTVDVAENEDDDFLGWYACVIDGHDTFVPIVFVDDGKLNRDYNPTELIQDLDDILEVLEIYNAWLLATNDKGVTGWIPAECVTSVTKVCTIS
jgi:hypothetical protein